MDLFNKILQKALTERENNGLLRALTISDESLIDFSSNDYLGLARSKELSLIIENRIKLLPNRLNGATGSRLLSGNSLLMEELEVKLANFFKSESTLVFNSGYNANLAILSSIPKRGDSIFYDALSHASIKDGLRLSLAIKQSFKHNDLGDLEKKIKKAKGHIYIVVESIYSMDGDEAPLCDLAALCEKYQAHLIVDEAHSTGLFGDHGRGLLNHYSLEEKVAIRVYTFGKAMGIHGACVAGSKELIRYLTNFARPFIYTTAMDQAGLVSISSSIDFIEHHKNLFEDLKKRIEHFTSAIKNSPHLLPSSSAIQSFVIAGNASVKQVARNLQNDGLDVRPILSPTVPEGKERLRIILHSFNTFHEIDKLVNHLIKLS